MVKVQSAQVVSSASARTVQRQIAARLDNGSGSIKLEHLESPQIDDLPDDIGELVEMGGQIFVLPAN